MNTIRRARRRPRVTSVNFRTLWWLVRREAFFQILAGLGPWSHEPSARRYYADFKGLSLHRLATRTMRQYPETRFR